MTHLRLAYRRDQPPDKWQRCDICEWVFFRFIIPLLVAAALIGWYWSLSHAVATPTPQQGDVQVIPRTQVSPSATVEPDHYRCHAGEGDAVVFEPLDDKGQGLIVLHCVNCRCDEEK